MRRIRRYNRTAEVIECAHNRFIFECFYGRTKLPLEACATRSSFAVPISCA